MNLSVTHLVSSLNFGGAERFVIDLSQQQKDDGINANIISFGTDTDPLLEQCKKNQLEVLTINAIKLVAHYRFYIAVKDADVVHIHSPHVLKFLVPILPLLISKKIIYTRHGAHPFNQRLWLIVHRFCQKYIDHITFVSEEGKQIFTDNHGWHSKNKSVIDNAVRLPRIIKRQQNNKQISLGSVGRMVDLKNQICLLEALTKLSMEELQHINLHFFGDGPCMGKLKTYQQQHLADCSIYFHGSVADRQKIYSSFDVLVVTSETEGLSLVIIEAMASECCVIATNVGGNPLLVSDNETGWLFEYNDSTRLANLIKRCLEDNNDVKAFAQKSKQKISEQFSLSKCAQAYQNIYVD
ncbi:glycosyltransferase family 4 protein [Thalassotalea fonticola]|uniref:Glycosyltransferase family 4 protein n=1 Tax=Thalassotalea fonticola TaxID=3065649 RepID=A0ABZ0GMP7_9GAMM|nr:glycosyltransferase family 4 protein [Colwelliaceae bacterium S1-1]